MKALWGWIMAHPITFFLELLITGMVGLVVGAAVYIVQKGLIP